MPTQAQRSDARRQAILEAALALFAERGFHGTAVPHIAERAGCGAGTIYRYFESKEILVNVLYQHWKRAIQTQVLDSIPDDLPLRVHFGQFWARILRFSAEHPTVMRFLELHHHGSYLDSVSIDLNNQINARIGEFFVHAQREHVVKDDPPGVLMGVVWGVILGLLRLADEGLVTIDPTTIEKAEIMAWEAIRR